MSWYRLFLAHLFSTDSKGQREPLEQHQRPFLGLLPCIYQLCNCGHHGLYWFYGLRLQELLLKGVAYLERWCHTDNNCIKLPRYVHLQLSTCLHNEGCDVCSAILDLPACSLFPQLYASLNLLAKQLNQPQKRNHTKCRPNFHSSSLCSILPKRRHRAFVRRCIARLPYHLLAPRYGPPKTNENTHYESNSCRSHRPQRFWSQRRADEERNTGHSQDYCK